LNVFNVLRLVSNRCDTYGLSCHEEAAGSKSRPPASDETDQESRWSLRSRLSRGPVLEERRRARLLRPPPRRSRSIRSPPKQAAGRSGTRSCAMQQEESD
jgi:hypothetical protein